MKTYVLLLAFPILVGCASSSTSSDKQQLPAAIRDKVRSIAGSIAEVCGTANIANDHDRLTGYACVRSALEQKRSFWFADAPQDDKGIWFVWVGDSTGKVFQLFSLGKSVFAAECKRFEVSLEKDGNIHCSM